MKLIRILALGPDLDILQTDAADGHLRQPVKFFNLSYMKT